MALFVASERYSVTPPSPPVLHQMLSTSHPISRLRGLPVEPDSLDLESLNLRDLIETAIRSLSHDRYVLTTKRTIICAWHSIYSFIIILYHASFFESLRR